MLRLFKKNSELEKLQKHYKKLMGDWHKLSTTNRAASDKKYSDAEKVLAKIKAIKS